MAFSAALTLTDLSDYLAPSQICIKPVNMVEDLTPDSTIPQPKDVSTATTEIVIDAEHGYYEKLPTGLAGKKLKKAEITLNDCLACSGCITSAESVLVSMQSHEEVYRVLEEHPDLTPVLSIAPQSLASLAALHGLTVEQTIKGLRAFFKHSLGFRLVFDTTFARSLSLAENRLEFLERKASSQSLATALTVSSPLPILSSACPGWICYAEKTHGELLPFVSAVKSSQAIMGTLVKVGDVASTLGLRPDQIYHVTVMPCYDKKLEASRPDFLTSIDNPESTTPLEVRDVDCVLTTGEVQRMLDDKSFDLATLAFAEYDASPDTTGREESTFFPSMLSVAGTSSGGYLHNTIQAVLGGLTDDQLYMTKLVEKQVRSEDYIEYTLVASSIASTSSLPISSPAPTSRTLLRAAKCYGFRNLQNVVRKIGRDAGVTVPRGAAGVLATSSSSVASANARRNAAAAARRKKLGIAEEEDKFDYVEVMACPSGCTNGGGQIAPPKTGLSKRGTGRVDAEGMPAMDEMMVDDKVISAKEWVAKVEETYWTIGSPAQAGKKALDWSRIDPSIVPYLRSDDSVQLEATMEKVLAGLTRGADRRARRRELLRTSYRAVEETEVNGLAVKW